MNTYRVTFIHNDTLNYKCIFICESTEVLYLKIQDQLDNNIPFHTDNSLKSFIPILNNIAFIEIENIKVGDTPFNSMINELNTLSNEQLQKLFNQTKAEIISTAFKKNTHLLTQNYNSFFKDNVLSSIVFNAKNSVFDEPTYIQALEIISSFALRIKEKS